MNAAGTRIGVAIGVSIANNTISGVSGTMLGSGTGEVFAYILDTAINATGAIQVDATSSDTQLRCRERSEARP